MIMIAGGSGFFGLNLARRLVDIGQEEFLLVCRRPFEAPSFLAPYMDKQAKVALGDILDPHFLYRTVKEYNVDSIVHLIEEAGSLRQSISVVCDGTANLLEVARVFRMRRVTYISSAAIYSGDPKRQPFQEDRDLPVESVNRMVACKKAAEQICQLYRKEYGLSVAIVRPSSGWGPLNDREFWPIRMGPTQRVGPVPMCVTAVHGEPGDYSHMSGETRRPYAYIRDTVKAISLVHLAPSLKHNIYNISDGGLFNCNEIAEAIREIIPEAQIKLGTGTPTLNPPCPIDRIKEDVGHTPDYDLKRGVRAYIDWLREGKYN